MNICRSSFAENCNMEPLIFAFFMLSNHNVHICSSAYRNAEAVQAAAAAQRETMKKKKKKANFCVFINTFSFMDFLQLFHVAFHWLFLVLHVNQRRWWNMSAFIVFCTCIHYTCICRLCEVRNEMSTMAVTMASACGFFLLFGSFISSFVPPATPHK